MFEEAEIGERLYEDDRSTKQVLGGIKLITALASISSYALAANHTANNIIQGTVSDLSLNFFKPENLGKLEMAHFNSPLLAALALTGITVLSSNKIDEIEETGDRF